MSKYRISVSIDEENFFWVVVDQERFIRNPTKEDLKETKLKYYSKTNMCHICREKNTMTDSSIIHPGNAYREIDGWICKHHYNMFRQYRQYIKPSIIYNKTNICDICSEKNMITDNSVLHPGSAYREKDKNGRPTGKWMCQYCYEQNSPNSDLNKRKANADCRNKNLDPNSNQGIGYITCTLVKKYLGVEDCFDITGNFNYPGYDLIETEKYGSVDTKGSTLIDLSKVGHFVHVFATCKNEKPDTFFCIGYDKDRKNVIVVYIIPNDEDIKKITGIHIHINGRSKYHKFRENKDEIEKWNNIYHTLHIDNCPVLKKISSKKIQTKGV